MGLLLRAWRDRSALPSTIGVLALACVAVALAGPRASAQQAVTLAVLALAAAGIAAFATPRTRAPSIGRRLFGVGELPWSWTGRGAIAQGFGRRCFRSGRSPRWRT